MNLLELQSDPVKFRAALLIDTDAGPRPLGDIMDPWQDRDFRALDSGWQRAVKGVAAGAKYRRGWLERPRGHSKTLDLAIMACWALFASRRQLSGVAAAGDQDQARLLRDAISKVVYCNPWLESILEVQANRVVNSRTGSALQIIASDAPTSYGLTPDFVVADEIVHWRKRDLWDALLSSAAKRSTCMFVVISNAGFLDDWQWATREAARTDPAWYFSRLDGPVARWITPENLAEQRRLLPPSAYLRLWENQWSNNSGDAVDADLITRAITLPQPPTPSKTRPDPAWIYGVGVDCGLRHDSTGLVVLRAKPSGKVQLCEVWKRTPRKGETIQLAEIVAKVRELHQRWGFSCLAYDPWQFVQGAQELASIIPVREIAASAAQQRLQAESLLRGFREGLIELYDDHPLIQDLRAASIEETGNLGGIRINWPRTAAGHCDVGAAFTLLLPLALATLNIAASIPEPPRFETVLLA